MDELREERLVSLEDVQKFENTDTWKALCDALKERRKDAIAVINNVASDERFIRYAQGAIPELDYVLDVYLPGLKEDLLNIQYF